MTKPRRRDNQTCTSSHREGTPSGLIVNLARSRVTKQRDLRPPNNMEPEEIQSGLPELSAYIDPDAPDMSEQQFAASLDAESSKPDFVVDDPEISPSQVARVLAEPQTDRAACHPPEIGISTLGGRDARPALIGED